MPSPIRLVLCGKSAVLAESFTKALNDETFRIIHVCHSLSSARAEIPILLSGKPLTNPATNLSIHSPSAPDLFSNSASSDKQQPQIPKAIVIGKGFSDSEIDDLYNSIYPPSSSTTTTTTSEKQQKPIFLTPDDSKFTLTMKAKAIATGGVMLPGVIAERVRICLRDVVGLGVLRGEGEDMGVWHEKSEGGGMERRIFGF